MGFFDWLFGRRSQPPQASPAPAPPLQLTQSSAPPIPKPPPRTLDLNPSDFLPIARDDLKEAAQNIQRWGPWFGRRDVIPPADDPRTKLIDRALVTHGLLTPEQLVDIHRVGDEMERLKPSLAAIEHAAALAGEAAVRADKERRAKLKEQKK